MADMRMYSREFVTRFINEYKHHPCLWQVNSPDYTNRQLKTISYEYLLELLRKVEPNADEFAVKKRIMSLRSSFRKERNKVKEGLESGVVYRPTLWYYNMFNFLLNQDEGPSINNVTLKTETLDDPLDVEMIFSNDDTNLKPSSSHRLSQKHHKVKKHDVAQNGIKGKVRLDDEYDAIGVNVAAKLRKLPNNMKLIAEKLISEVLFEARLGRLTPSTALMAQPYVSLEDT